MSYYKLLRLYKEPFSTSPDPDFFYESKEHKAALYRLKIAIDLKRGMGLVIGDVGTGKTTLSRKLSQDLSNEPNVIVTIILNPIYDTPQQFLADLMERLHIPFDVLDPQRLTVLDYMKIIERFLFEQGVEQRKTIVLIIDECQKMGPACLEVLRSLLNYETNEYKTLQLILLGQPEFLPKISQIKNLWDRIALKYELYPLDEREVESLIQFRLARAGHDSREYLFHENAIRAIFCRTQGYPRRIAMLCHDALEYLVMYKKTIVDKEVIQAIIQKEVQPV